jgi:hypothetical protein
LTVAIYFLDAWASQALVSEFNQFF